MLLGKPRANSCDLEFGNGILDMEEDLYQLNAELGVYDDQDDQEVNIVVNEEEEAGVQEHNGRVIIDEEEDEIQESGPEPQAHPQFARVQMIRRHVAAIPMQVPCYRPRMAMPALVRPVQ